MKGLSYSFFLMLFCILFLGCSNLNSPRFSKGFYEEKRMQLTRKAEFIANGRTQLVAFSTYMSELDRETYPEGAVFLVEIAFEDKNIKLKDLNFSLLGKKPLKIKKIKKKTKADGIFWHTHWNELYLLYFDAVPLTDITKVVLQMKVKNKTLIFDYSYIVENVL